MTRASYIPQDGPREIEQTSAAVSSEELAAGSTPRREVLNAIRTLREMPPAVREREIASGRYSHFTAEERELLRSAIR